MKACMSKLKRVHLQLAINDSDVLAAAENSCRHLFAAVMKHAGCAPVQQP